MDGAGRRRLTDALTVSRVPLALLMVLLRRHRAAVAGLFVVGVATDIVDGPLARRLGTASARGARLDSVADVAFVAASAVAAVATLDPSSRPVVVRAAAAVGVTRLVTLAVTRRRFGAWSVMHTRLNKATGLGLATVGAAALVRGRMPVVALAAAGGLAEVAALEELAIVASASGYDPDRRSLFA